jgi:carbonic anhydrase
MPLPTHICDDERYKGRLQPISSPGDIPLEWRKTPIEKLINSENFGHKIEEGSGPELLIAACIEFRYALPIPRMFAYVIRRASGRLVGSEFSIAYVLAAGVRHFALIGHNDCGMTKIPEKQHDMIRALVNQGWPDDRAEDFVHSQSARHMMKDELDGLKREYIRLRRLFKKVVIAPLFVDLLDTQLFIPNWYSSLSSPDVDDMSDNVLDVDLIALQ